MTKMRKECAKDAKRITENSCESLISVYISESGTAAMSFS